MKRAVSISLGSSKRNKAVEVELLGQVVSIERIGTDGDMEKAARMYQELDAKSTHLVWAAPTWACWWILAGTRCILCKRWCAS